MYVRVYMYVCMFIVCLDAELQSLKLIAFELAGEDRERRENPVVSRLRIAFYALHKRG
jgi:hypothetical protein